MVNNLNNSMSYVTHPEIIRLKNQRISSDYLFDASAKIITINDSDFKTCLYAVNVSDGVVIYNPTLPGYTGKTIANTVQLEFDTTAMNDSDELLVVYESNLDDDVYSALLSVASELREQTRILKKIYK